MRHTPINTKAYWVFLGPHFIPIRRVFYSFCVKEYSIRDKKELDEICLSNVKTMEEKLLEFSALFEGKGDKKSLSEINKISRFIKTLHEYFEESSFKEKLNLKSPILTEDSKYIQVVENISKSLKVA